MSEWLDLGELSERVGELLEMGLTDEAQQLLDSYSPAYLGQWEISYLSSRIAYSKGNYVRAVRCLRDCLRLGGHNADTYVGLFHAYSALGRMTKGARYLVRAHRRFPRNEEVLAALIWCYGEANAFAKALAIFRQAQEEPIRESDIYRNAGLIYQRMGNTEQAEKCYRSALSLAPGSEEFHDLLADLYLGAGETGKAVDVYEALLARSPNNVHALSRLVYCLGEHGHPRRAEEIARRTVSLYPNSPVGYVDLAYVYLNRGALDEAMREVDRALAVAPLEAMAYRARAIVLSEKGRDHEADQAFRSAISLAPENAELLRDYYHHLYKLGDYRRMEQVAEEVIRREKPYCVEDYWFLAEHFLDEGRPLKAFHCLNRAYKNMPGQLELLPPMVSIMLDRGHTSYAMSCLARYALRMGWNEAVRDCVRHRRLRSPAARESMRFLRYYADRSDRYREHAFRYHLVRAAAYVPLALFPVLIPLAWVIGKGGGGVAVWGVFCLVCYVAARVAMYLMEGPAFTLLQRRWTPSAPARTP